MVHLFHASFDLTAMVRPVHFPVATSAAPPRAAVRLTDKHILAVEFLETRAVGIVVGTCLVSGAGLEVSFVSAASFCLCLLVGRFWPQRRHAGIGLDDEKYSEVCRKSQEEEHKIENEESNRSAGLLLSGKEEID